MELNRIIGKRLREIRGKRTQSKFLDGLDLMTLKGNTRSTYSMIEIGKRSANLTLLDYISEREGVSFDYIFGIVDTNVNPRDENYNKLLEFWSKATDKDKKALLLYANQIMRGKGK